MPKQGIISKTKCKRNHNEHSIVMYPKIIMEIILLQIISEWTVTHVNHLGHI